MDRETFERLRAGDGDAQAAFWRAQWLGQVRRAAGVLGDTDEAEDVVQAALADFLLRHVRAVRRPETAERYLGLIVTRNAVKSRRRAARNLPIDEVERELSSMSRAGEDPEARLMHFETALRRDAIARVMKRACATLPVREREALRLRYHEGHRHNEVSRHLGLRGGRQSSSRVIRRALRRLRDQLPPLVPSPSGCHVQ